MDGALTHLRRYGARVAALRMARDAEPPGADVEAELARETAIAAGMPAAAPFLTGANRRDVADAAITALGRDRDLCFRILLQAGLGALFVAGLGFAGARLTAGLAVFAAILALPTWALALGGPDAFLAILLAAPLAGPPARALLHARLLTVLALLLGAETEPAAARAIAQALVGAPLPDAVIANAMAPGLGFGAAKVALRAESEAQLLRAAARLTQRAQLTFRFLILGVSAIALAALFAGGITRMRNAGMLGPKPEGDVVHVVDDDRERPATIDMSPRSTTTAGP